MKVNWQFLKKPSVIIGGIVFFFVLLFLLNRSGSSASTTTVTQGPDPATVAANAQLAMAQLSAGVASQQIAVDYQKSQDANAANIALAQIAAGVQNNQTAAAAAASNATVAAEVHGLDLQYQTAVANNAAAVETTKLNNDFALNYAAQTFQYGIDTAEINSNLESTLAADQLKGQAISDIFGSISSISGKHAAAHKETALEVAMATISGTGNSGLNIPTSGGLLAANSNEYTVAPITAAGQLA